MRTIETFLIFLVSMFGGADSVWWFRPIRTANKAELSIWIEMLNTWLTLLLYIRPAILQLSTRCPPFLTAFSFPLSLRSPAGVICPFPVIPCHIVGSSYVSFSLRSLSRPCFLPGQHLLDWTLVICSTSVYLFLLDCVETCPFHLAVFCTLWTAATVLHTSDDRCSVYHCEPAPVLSYLIHVFGQISLVLMFFVWHVFLLQLKWMIMSEVFYSNESEFLWASFCSLDMNECMSEWKVYHVCFSTGRRVRIFLLYLLNRTWKYWCTCGHTVGSYLNSAQLSAAQHVHPGFFSLLLLKAHMIDDQVTK